MKARESTLEPNPQWYKDAIIYQLHVRSFYDSNDDGIGDFRGLKQKLDYLEGLGVTALWLLPFYPSPLRDDGYDIADYENINPDYGSLKDFRQFLREAHKRNIRVITELVLNHTSSDHDWFQRSRQSANGSKWRDMYVWSDTPDRYTDTRVIFQDFEASNWSWDSEARAYYWHRFYSHQPDLNFDNPEVHRRLLKAIDFWFRMGVDGLRLDAVPYLYERENTNCENLPETHAFLQKLRAHVERNYEDKMLLAEANQWPEDAAAYFGEGNECHMAFHFPVMPRMFMAVHMEDSFPITDILRSTPPIPDNCQWAMFLRNHDELTLEMVTDEERDYMYRVYAKDPLTKINVGIRRRLAPLLDNNRRKIELLNILLFSLPGTPVIYYGDELGMGDNYHLGDRNGVRTPMQWSPDRNAGFSRANPQQVFLPVIIDPEHHFEVVNVETQERNPSSMLWWMKRVIGMRKQYKALSRGDFEMLGSDNHKVLAFARTCEDETVLVIANLSRFAQVVRLELSDYAGYMPEEVFSQNYFPTIRREPYVLTLGPHNSYWLNLTREPETVATDDEQSLPELSVRGDWDVAIRGKQKERLETSVLPNYLRKSRWFGAKARRIRKAAIVEEAKFDIEHGTAYLLILSVSYSEQSQDEYLLPVTFVPDPGAERIAEEQPHSVICRIKHTNGEGILYDALYNEYFRTALLNITGGRRKLKGKRGDFVPISNRRLRTELRKLEEPLPSSLLGREQSNSSVIYDKEFILKMYRRPGEGTNPEFEILQFLTNKARFEHVPEFAGAIEYRARGEGPKTVALLQRFVPNEGDAWSYVTGVAGVYLERILTEDGEQHETEFRLPPLMDVDVGEIPDKLQDRIGVLFLEMAALIGRRTGEMHLALASDRSDKAFRPEPFSLLYQKSLHQSLRSLTRRTLMSLDKQADKIPEQLRKEAKRLVKSETKVLSRVRRLLDKKISAERTRIHGDYHLGQLLSTGKDFQIIDFEGEPARTVSERRLKHSPLKDVAGMIRSFHYAIHSALAQRIAVRVEDEPRLESTAKPWFTYVAGTFLQEYMKTVKGASFIPQDKQEIQILLDTFLLEKAVYELAYELNNRPDWIIIPLKGLEYLLKSQR